jgi:hypothetical protein
VLLDRSWNVVELNQAAMRLLSLFTPNDSDPALLGNIVRALLHQRGLEEVSAYPDVAAARALPPQAGMPTAIVHLRHGDHEVRLFTMVTTLGTPLDVTAQELAIEAYFPADDASAAFLAALDRDG